MQSSRAALIYLTAVAAVLAGCAALGPGAMPAPASAASSPEPATDRQTATAARDSYIAHVLTKTQPAWLEGKRMYSVGSGFFIAPDKVLTNFHVAGDCAVVTVGNDSEGEEIPGKLIAGDAAVDLAVLSTRQASTEPARFESAIYTESGQGLVIVGYPEHGLAVRRAEVSPVSARPADLVAERARFRFDGEVRRGNSGGPILDDSGAVLGVVTAKLDTVAVYQHTGQVVDNIGYAIGNRTILDFLRANKIGFLPALPGGGLPSDALLEKAHGFVRQIGCWK